MIDKVDVLIKDSGSGKVYQSAKEVRGVSCIAYTEDGAYNIGVGGYSTSDVVQGVAAMLAERLTKVDTPEEYAGTLLMIKKSLDSLLAARTAELAVDKFGISGALKVAEMMADMDDRGIDVVMDEVEKEEGAHDE